jgi:hypothetical protein
MGWECRNDSEMEYVNIFFWWMICLLQIQEFRDVTDRSVVVTIRTTCCNIQILNSFFPTQCICVFDIRLAAQTVCLLRA